MMGLYEKNLEALNKRFPGMDKLIEEKKDELLQKENLDVESEINLEGREILKVQRNNRTLYLAGKRHFVRSKRRYVVFNSGRHAPLLLCKRRGYVSKILASF